MNDTPTPRTNAALRYCKTRNESGREDMAGYSVLGIQKIIVESKALERELTAVTQQRDRLAEALRKAISWGDSASHHILHRQDINWTYLNEAREALQSLNQPTEL